MLENLYTSFFLLCLDTSFFIILNFAADVTSTDDMV
jgi:hypothetical protein